MNHISPNTEGTEWDYIDKNEVLERAEDSRAKVSDATRRIVSIAGSLDLPTVKIATVIAVNILLQRAYTRDNETWSEAICWCLVGPWYTWMPEVFGSVETSEASSTKDIRSWDLWIVASGLVIVSLAKSTADIRWVLPVVTPLLVVFQAFPHISTSSVSRRKAMRPVLLATVIAAIAIISLWPGHGSISLTLAVVAASVSFGVCATLETCPDFDLATDFRSIQSNIARLSYRVVGLLLVSNLIQYFVLYPVWASPSRHIFVGMLKAASWILLFESEVWNHWVTVNTTQTFALEAISSYAAGRSLSVHTPGQAVATSLALYQVIECLPKKVRACRWLWIYGLVACLPFLRAFPPTSQVEAIPQIVPLVSGEHPVETISRRAQVQFQNLLVRQSMNFQETIDEYKRRYGWKAPPGFDKWYAFARKHNSAIMDDFDNIHEHLAPFREMTSEQIQTNMHEAYIAAPEKLWKCSIRNGTASAGCQQLGPIFISLMKEVGSGIPDVELLINALDEPRVLRSRDSQSDSHTLDPSAPIEWEDHSHRSVWGDITELCGVAGTKDSMQARLVETFGLPFVQNARIMRDLCQHPEYADTHGFFLSPTTFRYTKSAVPILSSAGLSTMGDIPYPPSVYYQTNFAYEQAEDIDWNDKRNKVYWAGKTTGGFATSDDWKNLHRQRFMTIAKQLDGKNFTHLEPMDDGTWRPVVSLHRKDEFMYQVTFTRINQCEPQQCAEETQFFHPQRKWRPKNEGFNFRFVYDIDGNSYSGRYYRLLASHSCPLKTTVFQEWHDERLVPWVHYVPVSLGMEELPELVHYLATTGQRRAREIAENGRAWYFKALRPVDQQIYLYRLLLELARLQDTHRRLNE